MRFVVKNVCYSELDNFNIASSAARTSEASGRGYQNSCRRFERSPKDGKTGWTRMYSAPTELVDFSTDNSQPATHIPDKNKSAIRAN